ncbi:hypothetical protein PG997_006585 [Apiospora hydei]|uniref:Tudor domain-containing protein n=1 Tax=Apiospora hydei TaxID=1337664 RepID=A0ABR1WP60_9PEZI
MADIASIQDDIKQYQEQVDFVNAGLKDDSGNAELLALKSELDDALNLLNETLAELKPAKAAPPPKSKAPSPPPAQEKWSRENHPRIQEGCARRGEGCRRWSCQLQGQRHCHGEMGFGRQRLLHRTHHVHHWLIHRSYLHRQVQELRYDRTATVQGYPADRPETQSRRYACSEQHALCRALSHSPPSNPAPGVISAAASINPELAQKNREAAEKPADDAKPKFKKIKATKELEAGKNKWQEFNSKSKFAKGHKTKKDSMFRTPDGVHGRVGFTGSGQAMRKDPTRSRHIYQANEELD